jgi:hypothetical protein
MIYRAEERYIRLLLAGDAMPARSLKPFDESRYTALLALSFAAPMPLSPISRRRCASRRRGRRA